MSDTAHGDPIGQAPPEAVAVASRTDGAWAYRGKAGCKSWACTQDGNPDRCYGWHCGRCHGPSNCQADCVACDRGVAA